MANTLTDLTPDLYKGLDIVSRELVGMIPAVTLDADVSRAALNQVVRSHVAPASTSANITPGQLPPNTGDQTIGNKTISITKSKGVPIRWNGEEQRGMNSGGPGYRNILGDQFEQAFRTLVNEMEADLTALHTDFSRGFGTAGTTPFASTLTDTANVLKILKDNGSPLNSNQLVIDTTAGAKMLTLTQLTKANEAADSSLLRQGVLLDVHGMQIRESGQIATSTAGTGTSYLLDDASSSVGDTLITVDTGSGTIIAGDLIVFAGDTEKYVVETALSGSTLTIAAPGLRTAIADSATITVQAAAARNMCFAKSAIVLATRVPMRPEEGDSVTDVVLITDPRSGITFEVAMYGEYRQVHYEVSAAWGQAVMKPEHTAILLG